MNEKKNQQSDKLVFESTVRRLFWLVAGSLISGVVGGIFVGYSVAQSDHFLLRTIDSTVSAIPDTYVRQDIYQNQLKSDREREDQLYTFLTKQFNDLKTEIHGKNNVSN